MPHYEIIFLGFMLCTDYELPEYVTNYYFTPACKSEWCQGEALTQCLTKIEHLQYGTLIYECLWRKK